MAMITPTGLHLNLFRPAVCLAATLSLAGGSARRAEAATPGTQYQAIRGAALKSGASAATAQSLAQAVTTTITERTKLTAPAGSTAFGFSVSLSGDRALVGSFSNTTGAAYVYAFNGRGWSLQATLTAPDGGVNDAFGSAVSLSGDRALIGAPSDDGTVRPGAAFVFFFDGTSWSEEAKLTASDGFSTDYFGMSVSLQGSRALIGAVGSNAAYIYTRTGSTWDQEVKLSRPGSSSGFGTSVSLSAKMALIGSPVGSDGFTGSAFVYTYDGSNWLKTAELKAGDGEPEDDFGAAVALSGIHAFVGAPEDNSSQGSAYVYQFDGTRWIFQVRLSASDGTASDHFGFSISLAGNRALIGAVEDDTFTGSAYLYAFDGTSWTEQQKLVASDGAPQAYFGSSVALSGQLALVGASNANGGTGAAYLFGRP